MPDSGARFLWRDEFSGTALNPAWSVKYATNGVAVSSNGTSYSIANSQLTLNTGTGNGDAIEVDMPLAGITSPVRVQVVVDNISQRITNQEFSIELVESDAQPDAGNDRAEILFNGTNTTQAMLQSYSNGDASNAISMNTSTTGSNQVFELIIAPDEVWAYSSPSDSTASRGSGAHVTRRVPDPSKELMVRFRAKNTGAAASTTAFVIESVLVEAYTDLPVEIVGGRGAVYPAEAEAINIASGSVTLLNTNTISNKTGFWNAASVGANGTSTSVNMANYKSATILVNVSAATNITAQVSPDNGSTWYPLYQANGTIWQMTFAGAGLQAQPLPSEWASSSSTRLMSSAAATITAGYALRPV